MAADPLTEALDSAMAEQGLMDSEEPVDTEPEEQPEEPEEEIDEELPEEDAEFDEDLEDFEEDFEDEEVDDEDDDAPEDDEADEAEESDEADLSFDDLDPDMTVPVKVRGEELEVSLQELRDGYSREEDYTRDKQQLREREQEVQQVYEQMKDWYESRASDPAGWVQEVLTEESDEGPDVTLAQAISRSENPTGLLARTFKVMAQAGTLDREFVEAFDDKFDMNSRAENAETEDRITRLERELEEERERREREQRQRQQRSKQQELIQQYEQQWSSIKSQEGLDFESAQDEFDAKRELVEFARNREIVNLEDAWSAMQYRRRREQQQDGSNKPKRSKKAREAAKRKKKKARAMNRKPKGGQSPPKRKSGDTDAAVKEAARELGIL